MIKVAILPGDGIGPEVVAEGVKVLEAVERKFSVSLEKVEFPCGGRYYLETGREWPPEAWPFIEKEADAVLLGAVGWPGATLPGGDIAGAGIVFGLRFGLDLYANVRPTKLYEGVRHKIGDRFLDIWNPSEVDFTIVRENTEGEYTPARGFLRRGGTTELSVDSTVITRRGSERVVRMAFELSRRSGGAPEDRKKRVTCVDKSNVLRGSQLFREVFDEVSKEFPDVEKDYAYVDAFAQWILRRPGYYNVAVTTNMFGDILTDLASVLSGGMGLAPSGNIGDHHAMFEPIHGSAPRHAGSGTANPMATILAVSMMLDWIGKRRGIPVLSTASKEVERAVAEVLREGKVLTYDLGGSSRTSEVGDAVVKALESSGGSDSPQGERSGKGG